MSSLNTKVFLLAFFCKLIFHPLKKNVVFDNFGGQKLFMKGKVLNNSFWHFSEGEFHIESEILPISSCHYPEFENGCHESKQQTYNSATPFCLSWHHGYSLCGNLGGLSLTSERVMLTVVVPANPPSCPPISLAWIITS